MAAPFDYSQVECVASVDALGFILGTAVACRLDVGVIPVREGNKLPVETYDQDFQDYSGETKRPEVRKDAFPSGTRVLLVDEWIETGAQVNAAIKLIEAQRPISVPFDIRN